MSSADEMDEICASCGITGVDNVGLKKCTACKLVKYCSVECQRNHRPQHKRDCKKRVAELRDELLFKQPESTHLGDCPICFIPIPLDEETRQNSAYYPCCSKTVCLGCVYASRIQGAEQKCPFCRKPCPKDSGEAELMMKKRIAANDPVAIREVAIQCLDEGNFRDAFRYAKQAADGGDMEAHLQLGVMYMEGKGVEADLKKAIYHLEEAAIGGHPTARLNLGLMEGRQGRHERAMKHFIIAANQGENIALEKLKVGYVNGHVSKDDFAAALRAYQRAVDATKSPQREAAKRNQDFLNTRATKVSRV
jgi:tetratricopeptide (TPR) repeat protein